jgi:cytochrome P450
MPEKLRREFEAVVQTYLKWPRPGSLAALAAATPASGLVPVARQIPHWMFAMNETLAANSARALALIAAHPQVQEGVRHELSAARFDRPAEIDRLRLLGGCLQEAMRLWPTTPMLMRELIATDSLDSEPIARGTRVLIPTSFVNRDVEACISAHEFLPQRWIENPPTDQFHHLSNGTQACAGRPLALFLGKAVLATLLQGARIELRKPRLDSGKPVPEAFDYFRLRFSMTRRAG